VTPALVRGRGDETDAMLRVPERGVSGLPTHEDASPPSSMQEMKHTIGSRESCKLMESIVYSICDFSLVFFANSIVEKIGMIGESILVYYVAAQEI
jgi:hypothetical protein